MRPCRRRGPRRKTTRPKRRSDRMRNYRENWFNVGAILAMAIAGALALSGRRLSRPRLFSALNLAALMVHQFEEYGFPGYFPGKLNAGVFNSDKPERYPLNTNSALVVNAVVGYPFYLLPVLLPKRRSLGLAPALFGFGQAVFHGIVPPFRAKALYGPGFLTAFFLHVPIGINYLRAIGSERPLERGEWPVRRPTRSPSRRSGSVGRFGC